VELADRLRILRVHGTRQKYHHECIGINSRLDALQAAILRVKLAHLPAWTAARQLRAEAYREMFEASGLEERVALPAKPGPNCTHVYNQFVVRVRNRDALRVFLTARGIPTEIYYPLPLHLQPAFAYLGYRRGQLPVAETTSERVLALPIHPEMTQSRQERVVKAIADFYAGAN
jgi:dTDP-4-amino-4,6-dideoxygalactose transaminase